MELDTLAMQRRQVEEEISILEEKRASGLLSLSFNEEQAKRRVDQLERQCIELEKKAKNVREATAAANSEHVLVLHALEDAKRQQVEIERSIERRKKAVEEVRLIACIYI